MLTSLEHRQVGRQLVRGDVAPVGVPLGCACCAGRSRTRARRGSRRPARSAPSSASASVRFCGSDSYPIARRSVSVSDHTSSSVGRLQLVALLHAGEAGAEDHREGQVGVARACPACGSPPAAWTTCPASTSAPAPARSGWRGPSDTAVGRLAADDQPLVGVHPLVGDRGDLPGVPQHARRRTPCRSRRARTGRRGRGRRCGRPRTARSACASPSRGASENGLGMNEARTPWVIATSFTTYRKVMMLSAMVSASA